MASPVPQKDDVERWTVEQVAAWLRQMEMTDCCEYFLRKGIDGRSLMELTEEGLVLWGRDVSIRNRKKIMKLVRQIENQYLISTGRLQQREILRRSPQNTQFPHDQGRESIYSEESDTIDDDAGFESDEFDDVYDIEPQPMSRQHDEVHQGYAANNPDSSSAEDIYLEPIPPPVNRNYPPTPLPRPEPKPHSLPVNPPLNRQPFLHPEKRPPMPLPYSGVNQGPPTQNSTQRLGGQIGGPKLPPGRISPSSDPPRRPAPHPGSSLPSPGTTTPLWQIGAKPLNTLGSSNVKASSQLRDWTQKKPSEPSSTQNSNYPESSVEGGGGLSGRMGYAAQQRPHLPLPNTNTVEGNSSNKKNNFFSDLQQKFSAANLAPTSSETAESDYEIVENPVGPFPGNESHSGNPPGKPGLSAPSQNPPPLPQRNQDGNRPGPNLQQPPVSSNVPHSRVHPQLPQLPALPTRSAPTPVTGASNSHQSRPPPPLPGGVSNVNQTRPSPPLPGGVSNVNQTRPSPPLPGGVSIVNQTRPSPPLPGGISNVNQIRPSPPLHGRISNINQNWAPPQNKTLSQKGNSVGHNVNQIRLPPPPPPQTLKFQSQPTVNSPPIERAPPLPSPLVALKNPIGGFQAAAERVPIGDGESIELNPLYRSLVDRPYFHVISRSKSKQLLEKATDGVYLIRPSTRSSDPLTLCLRYSSRTYNINIRERRDHLYALGSEKDSEMTFSTIHDIVTTHTNEPLKLQNGDRVRLTTSPPKADNMYVKMPQH